jgi:hypothetical protein
MHLTAMCQNRLTGSIDKHGLQGLNLPDGGTCCKCGPDVTHAVRVLLNNMGAAFNNATLSSRQNACGNLMHPINGFDSWEMSGITDLSWGNIAHGGTPFQQFERVVCAKRCGHALTYKGKCVPKIVLNYILLGYALSLCNQESVDTMMILLHTGWAFRGGDPSADAKEQAVREGFGATSGSTSSLIPVEGCSPNSERIKVGPQGWGSVSPGAWRWDGLNN